MLEVQVRYNGIGIIENEVDKVFDLFGFMEKNQVLNTQDMRLGLYICKKIVKMFGGDIICKS